MAGRQDRPSGQESTGLTGRQQCPSAAARGLGLQGPLLLESGAPHPSLVHALQDPGGLEFRALPPTNGCRFPAASTQDGNSTTLTCTPAPGWEAVSLACRTGSRLCIDALPPPTREKPSDPSQEPVTDLLHQLKPTLPSTAHPAHRESRTRAEAGGRSWASPPSVSSRTAGSCPAAVGKTGCISHRQPLPRAVSCTQGLLNAQQ